MLRPMSKIHIPTPLRQYVGKQSTVEVKGATVGEAMNDLVAQHPDLRRHLYADDGKLRAFVNLLCQRRGHSLPAEGSDRGEGR
jgi:sulfur-carrier protein